MINVYGMRTESEMPEVYKDFIRHEGAPTYLRRDNAQVQKSKKVTTINRELLIGDQFTEPHHPQQNPAELQAVKFLKDHSQVIMDRSGADEKAWFDCCEYVADVHNICANDLLNGRTPLEKRHGYTPDISAYLLFTFWEEVLYLDAEESFPSTKEKRANFLNVAKNVGDALTFKLLTQDTKEIIYRSVVRPANDNRFRNLRAVDDEDADDKLLTQSIDDPIGPMNKKPTLEYSHRRLKIDKGLSKRPKTKQIRRQRRRSQKTPPVVDETPAVARGDSSSSR
jgi:viroplasmin and RNaseH domain-containing protein